jgi:hypothetical protein
MASETFALSTISRVTSNSLTFFWPAGVHQFQHQLFQNHAQAARADFADHRLSRNRPASSAELQPYIFEFKQTLILLDDGILRSRQNFYQRVLIQIFAARPSRADGRQIRESAQT